MLYGKDTAKKIEKGLKNKIKKCPQKPGLAVILIGKNSGSLIYVKLKQKAAKRLGMKFKLFRFPASIAQKKIIAVIKKINQNKNFHGLIVQMPLPKKFNPDVLVENISPQKDVDGFGPKTKFISPVYQAVLKLIQQSKRPLKNKKFVILGKNPVFTYPLKNILEKKKLIVEIIDLKNFKKNKIKNADFLIVALGKPNFLKPFMIKKNAVIIDVGYNRSASGKKGKSVGDVDSQIHLKTHYLSPVPGGIGPLTVIYLLKNVYLSAK
ncbi:MAG: bifunctional 5,10-methylenetetrahydrofolate dehydrogenase/5,10-methenyltetrahydrofolate cyclohydrolase [Patescibacteria group bacterium]|nr:bifunctional 5,10-methylenetetrahydrofolate dehydrogenase/5,10-methenyltetrahydrofolate cyclohydrolase [Patescibacteria group bacterium]